MNTEDPVAKAINEGENRYRQTVLSQGPLPGYEVVTPDREQHWCERCGGVILPKSEAVVVDGKPYHQIHRPGLSIERVQGINRNRADRWHGGDFKNWSGLEWAGALCGEAGEAANVCKKLRRVETEAAGNAWSERPLNPEQLRTALAGECADTFLYLCLLASRYDIDLAQAIRDKFNSKSAEMGFPERL